MNSDQPGLKKCDIRTERAFWLLTVLGFFIAAPAFAQQGGAMPTTTTRPDHATSAQQHEGDPPAIQTPPLPEGMSLDDVLEYADSPPPSHFPDPIPDDALHMFTLLEQVEWRVREEGKDQLGWEAQGWIGYDYDKFWWKSEGESVFDGPDEGESETDLLYSRLITPFWNAQVGVQYANAWESGDFDDRWSGVVALQGVAPGMFEIDSSLYLSEHGDVTAEIEVEYDIRITQRLVLQPRAELGFAAQDIPERMLGAGMTDANLDLRLRYEIKREIAPYIGVRYRFLTGETAARAEAAGIDTEQLFFLAGVRLAF